jgi:acetyl-CoA C-acetyltransferase
MEGDFPINPSGGLLGLGHPVGATGIRMLLDCANQVTGRAGACQIDGARNMATFNLGGSATTCVSLIVGVD